MPTTPLIHCPPRYSEEVEAYLCQLLGDALAEMKLVDQYPSEDA